MLLLLIVCAFVIARAITMSAGDRALKNSVSSSTWLNIMIGVNPADSSKRRRDVEAEARIIFGIEGLIRSAEAKAFVKRFTQLWAAK